MNEEQHAAWSGYLRTLADALDLKDWKVTLMSDRPENPAHVAEMNTIYGRRIANVWIADRFLDDPAEEQRETLVHELLHVHINPIKLTLQNARSNLGESTYGVVMGFMDDMTELAVDNLARVIAPSLPLPPEKPKEITAEVVYAMSSEPARSDFTHDLFDAHPIYCPKCHKPVTPNTPGTIKDSTRGWCHTKCTLAAPKEQM